LVEEEFGVLGNISANGNKIGGWRFVTVT